MRARHSISVLVTKAIHLALACAMLAGLASVALDAGAFSAAPGSLTGRTNKDGGTGCAGCHAQDGALSVSLSGPASLPVRGTGSITLTATKAAAGSGVKLGMAAAASDGTLAEGSIYLSRVDPPGEIIHSALGGTGGTLATTNASGIATYVFSYRMPDDAAVGSTHTIYALARLGGTHGWNHAPNLTITATANTPPAPTIGAVAAGNAQATVSFTPPATTGGSPITGYTVTSSPGGITATDTSSPITVTGLANGTAYTFTVFASNLVGDGEASASSASVVAGGLPSAPLNVAAVRGNAGATVTFDPPAITGTGAISQYTVTSTPGSVTASGAASPITVTGLTNGTAYTFTVKAANTFGAGPDSASSSVVTPQPIPGTPTNVVATPGNGQVTLAFDAAPDGGSPITSYAVTVTPSAGSDSGAGTAALARTISGLANGTNYTFTITAVNAFGSGPPSAQAFATPYTVPGAPTGMTAISGNAAATVSFVAPSANGSAITGYTVLSNPPGGIDSGAAGLSLTRTINNLMNGTSYTFTVIATNAAGSGPASSPSNAIVAGAANAPRVVWTRVLSRGQDVPTTCPFPGASRGPLIDVSGDVYVNGCSRTLAGTQDINVVKIDGYTSTVLWETNFTDFAVANSEPLSYALAGVPSYPDVFLVSTAHRPGTSTNAVRIAKYSFVDGQLLWTGGYPSQAADESATDIAVDSAGNLFINAQAPASMHTVKINGSTGAQIWHGNVGEFAQGMALDDSGNVLVTGSVQNSTRDFRVMYYHGINGNEKWNAFYDSFPVSGDDAGRVVAYDGSSGGAYVAGDSLGGAAVVKFGGLGQVVWSVLEVATKWSSIAVHYSGAPDFLVNPIVTGSSNNLGTGWDIRTTKYNGATGAVIWTRAFNGSRIGDDFGSAVALDANGNVVVVGRSSETNGFDNIRVLKYRGSDGELIWSHEYPSPMQDAAFQVAIAPDGAAIVTGRVAKIVNGSELAYDLVVQKLADITPPGAPGPVVAIAQPGAIRVQFFSPSNDGGTLVTSYTATCGTVSASAGASPIIISGLTPGMSYACHVVANNSAGSGPVSATVFATPLAAMVLTGVSSRKLHGSAGPFELPRALNVPITGAVSVEPRAAGVGHQIVFTFSGAISNAGSASMQNSAGMIFGSATTTANGNDVIVTLASVADASRVSVVLTGVNGSVNASAALGFLLGDVNGSRSVDATDLAATRAQSGKAVAQDNFRHDINFSGFVGAADLSAVKARIGRSMP